MFGLFILFSYAWPLDNGSGGEAEKEVTSTFCDYRPKKTPHFHEGIDIPEDPNAYALQICVWPIYCGKVVKVSNSSKIVVIAHYAYHIEYDENNIPQVVLDYPLEEGSRYIHADPTCEEDETVIGLDAPDSRVCNPVAYGWNMENNHLHLEYRKPAPTKSSLKSSINPFSIPALNAPDNISPTLDYLYVDASEQGDAEVECWNFLGYNFNEYYNSTEASPFIKLELPTETPDNDLDDPHILIKGERKVRFVLEGDDEVTKGYTGCAPYEIMLFLNTDKIGGLNTEESHYYVRFDSLSSSTDEKHQEEDVYHVDAPLESGINAPQYYRLYPYDAGGNGLPCCILSGDKVLKTEELDDGCYQIRIFATDYRGNVKTADVHFYILKNEQGWVDFCRCFTNEEEE